MSLVTSIKAITNSKYLDIIGVLLVIGVSVYLKYYKTTYNFHFNNKEYVFYLGYFSIINTCLSMTATRLVTKKNNLGNLISTCNTLLSGAIDYLLGNVGAILTYPISFLGNYVAFKIWKKKQYLNSIDFIFFKNMFLGLFLSVLLNYIAFTCFSDKDIEWKLFFAIAIPAGISFGGTFNLGRMYPDNWINWQAYNIFKIIQNIMLLNIANTVKYVFYLFNASIGYITWRDDKAKQL
ncbi:nicotinamide mononucleotide transporter [Flavobacterium jejuense]|uniref:Nicotinamide mononucleotide transporter n=1 Tax=Flavobacterium jejuense TaxID=1544455 RepID=A0ABX0IZL3_9FLAO|nr:nicotinamide mononucleotide transporter family protein [Flavobacterium jejuense]NHN27431.1 nicotinamide mononucleotide transporter [Flavobacterium jejuense]